MYRILSLSGGGYLGLFTAHFLELIEGNSGPIGSRFDLIAGTSVGGLIALGLAAGWSATEIRDEIESSGPDIFPYEPGGLSRLFAAGHSTVPLAKVVDRLLGTLTLDNLGVPLIAPSVCITSGRAHVFRTPHLSFATGDRNVMLRDVALATAAAPTYYKPHTIGTQEFADGGLVANAPDALAAADAMAMQWPRPDVRMLAVGTTFSPAALAAKKKRRWGTWSWVRGQRLLNAAMAGQMDLSRRMARTLLSTNSIIVADPQQSSDHARELGLDRVTEISTATLKSMADAEYRMLLETKGMEINAIRTYTPKPAYFFE